MPKLLRSSTISNLIHHIHRTSRVIVRSVNNTPTEKSIIPTPHPQAEPVSSPQTTQRTMSLAAAIAAISPVLLFPSPVHALSLQESLHGLEDTITAAGPIGPLLFIIAYAGAAVVLVPASALTLLAGFLFGPVAGTAIVSLASTAGAAAAFLLGRYVARPRVQQLVGNDDRFAAVDAAIGKQGARIVLLLRLSPLFPYSVLNYALSLTAIEFGPYIIASWAGMLPGTVAYVALGGAGKAAAESAAGAGPEPLQLALYGLGALSTLGVAVLVSRTASEALKEVQEGSD